MNKVGKTRKHRNDLPKWDLCEKINRSKVIKVLVFSKNNPNTWF